MTRLRGMIAWLATQVEEVPSEETTLQELEENVETSSADKVETSSPVDSLKRGNPGPHVPQNIQSI